MKKTALILDFAPKVELEQYDNCDVYIIDRYNGKIIDVLKNSEKELLPFEDLSLNEFYQEISEDYQEILCLFLSYAYDDVSDYLVKEEINLHRTSNQAKLYMYLLNYINDAKHLIVKDTLKMIEANHDIKDIIVRIHNNRKKEVFSINDLIMRYLMNYVS